MYISLRAIKNSKQQKDFFHIEVILDKNLID